MKLDNFKNNKIFGTPKKENGFTIVELLLVVVIIAIITAVISMLYISFVRSQKGLLNKAGSEANLRTTLYVVAKDIREAAGINAADSGRIIINTSTDPAIISTIEYVSILQSNKTYTLNKIVTTGGVTADPKFVMEYIINKDIFSYYITYITTPDGVPPVPFTLPMSAQDLLDFKLININFTVNKEPSLPARAVSLSTVVSIRNR